MSKKHSGQALIELIVAIAVSSLALPAVLTGMVSAREGKIHEEQRIQGTVLMREMKEALKNIRDNDWEILSSNGTFYPIINGSTWNLSSGIHSINNFQRSVIISDVQRDSTGNIVSSGGIVDPSTKKAEFIVSWQSPSAQSITSTEYLSRYKRNALFTQTSSADFDTGSHSNTRTTGAGGGTVELSPPSSTGGLFTDNYDNSVDYNFDTAKIEVTGGFAQLKNLGGAVSGSTTNGTFNSNAVGWTFGTWGQNTGTTGSYVATGGNTGGYVNINFPSNRNVAGGGYWQQAISTSAANPTVTLTFQHRVFAYAATPDIYNLGVFLDNSSGAPVNQVWTSGPITATSAWSGNVTVNLASFMTTPGTYYLKVGAFVDFPNSNRGPYTVGYDNVLLSWNGNTASFPSDNPTVTQKSSFSASSVTSWTSFTETAELNGGSIGYQLSDDNGNTWKYHSGGGPNNWVDATSNTQYNSASQINQRISGFPVTNKQIRVRAFLIGNGTQQVKLDKIEIGYSGGGGNNSGTFTSSSFDAGSVVGYNRIIWNGSGTSNTTTQFQVASNTDNVTWNYVGPDGTSSSYFTNGPGAVPLNSVRGRYLRYRILFSSTNSEIPSVSDVSINYSP